MAEQKELKSNKKIPTDGDVEGHVPMSDPSWDKWVAEIHKQRPELLVRISKPLERYNTPARTPDAPRA